MFNNRGRRRKFHTNNNRPFRRRHDGEGRGSNSPNAIMNGQFRQNSFKGPYNTAKLMEKYNILAKEALSTGDKILAENYFQHADHFTRILSEKEGARLSKVIDNPNQKKIEIEPAPDNMEQKEKKTLET